MKQKIFIALSTFAEFGDEPMKLLKKSGLDFHVNGLKKRLVQSDIIQYAKDCDGIIAGVEPYDNDVLDKLPKLKCISRAGVGVDNISLSKAREKKIKILNTPDVVILPVAELTVAMIFDLLKKLTLHTTLLRAKRWEKHAGFLLSGRKIGILGLGRIGKKVARLLKKLDADVYGADVAVDRAWAKRHKIKIVPVKKLLGVCDVLTIHISPAKEIPFYLGRAEIARMKKGAMLVNVSRGSLVDDNALYDALRMGHLAGAALDVFSREPYAGKLCELDNVILTPHIATLTCESRLEMEILAVENLIRYFKKQ